MCLRVDATGNGDGEGTHLLVFLHFMKGSHDDELTWPLKAEYEIKLLNRISDSEHHSGPMITVQQAPSLIELQWVIKPHLVGVTLNSYPIKTYIYIRPPQHVCI